LFGWREFANRRELAGCIGLAPTPYASRDSEIEQGISKTGNRRVRAMLAEQAWKWLQLQPDSALTQWFNRRFAGGAKACAGSASSPWRGAAPFNSSVRAAVDTLVEDALEQPRPADAVRPRLARLDFALGPRRRRPSSPRRRSLACRSRS
jgi:hypothetical protein